MSSEAPVQLDPAISSVDAISLSHEPVTNEPESQQESSDRADAAASTKSVWAELGSSLTRVLSSASSALERHPRLVKGSVVSAFAAYLSYQAYKWYARRRRLRNLVFQSAFSVTKEQVGRYWCSFDLDDTGLLHPDRVHELLSTLLKAMAGQRKLVADYACIILPDTTDDDTMDAAEAGIASVFLELSKSVGAVHRALIDRLDVDGDGMVSKDEFTALFGFWLEKNIEERLRETLR